MPARRGADRLVSRVVRVCDENPPSSTAAALEVLAIHARHAIGAAAWSVLETTDDGAALREHPMVRRAQDHHSRLSGLGDIDSSIEYPLADYPAAAFAVTHGTVFLAALDLEDSDPAEIQLLGRQGYHAVLGVGISDDERGYLVKIYSLVGHDELDAIAAEVRVFATYCLSQGRQGRDHRRGG